ncbi:MAG: HAMP domain-containing protein [Candidatus Omnitrophica bacterium]|nr:HAMP domain-containing protein [Candidatus Omnitrophota bacterium]MBU1997104.1 HAMP domain-containing protein [Candidatus Omnitrophota bacterium]MBU4334053.1 HAMP domain-containing protein [Candidatus Omnitrophota bacterium]
MAQKKLFKLPLRSRYALTIIAVTFSIVGVLSYTSFIQFNTTLDQIKEASTRSFEEKYLFQIKQKAQILVTNLAITLKEPLHNSNLDEMQSLLESTSSWSEVKYSYIYDSKGRIIQSSLKDDAFLIGNVLADKISRNAIEANKMLIQHSGEIVDASHPIIYENKIIGGIRTGFSLEKMKKDISSIKEDHTLFRKIGLSRNVVTIHIVALTFAVLGIIISFFIGDRLAEPITTLSKLSARIGAGEYDVEIPINRSDEIGDLADAFRIMAMEIKKTQSKLIQTEKLSSLGMLASGVAHEINNPLAGVLTLLRLRKKKLSKETEDYLDYLDMIAACEHIATIVTDLLSFSRDSKIIFTKLNINDAIDSSLNFILYQLIKSKIKVNKYLDPFLPFINGDKGKLQQVVVNLLSNAKDAMPDGGEITIITKVSSSGKNVLLEIADTGSGIKKENLAKIFDPFFTTKEIGKGTGLGLAVTNGIVDKHNGKIFIESELGFGTKFIIAFPILTTESLEQTI